MKKRLAEIAFRRCELLEIIEAQRSEIACISAGFEKPIQIFDAGVNTVSFIKRHPTLIIGSLTAVLTFFRHGIPGINYLIPPILQFTFSRILSTFNSIDVKQPDLDSMN